MNAAGPVKIPSQQPLCLVCGLCCNGVIFADVKLQPGDDAARLQFRALLLSSSKTTLPGKVSQPCMALAGCHCRIYSDRPRHCREFECLLLKKMNARQLDRAVALRLIKKAQDRAEIVRRLLRDLGDGNEHLPLSLRFRAMAKEIERSGLDAVRQEIFARLTLAFHDLNVLLSTSFYPG
jgi:Fe-S-cluster containining protein